MEHFLGFYDVHADCLAGLFTKRKRVVELCAAFRRLRVCYPRRRLYTILDNLPHVHDHPRFLQLLRQLRITPVFPPTDASWLNLIEAQFGLLKRFTLTDTDDPEPSGPPAPHRALHALPQPSGRYRPPSPGAAPHR